MSGIETKNFDSEKTLEFVEMLDGVSGTYSSEEMASKSEETFESEGMPKKAKNPKNKFEKFKERVKNFFADKEEKTLEEEVDEIVREKENTSDIVEEKIEKEEDTSDIVEEEAMKIESPKKKKIKDGFVNWLLVVPIAKITASFHARAIRVPEGVISKYANISTIDIPSPKERFEVEKAEREAEAKAIAEQIATNAVAIPKVDESNKENNMSVDEQSIDTSNKEKITNPIDNSINIVPEVQKTEQTAMEQADLNAKYREITELGNEVKGLLATKKEIEKEVKVVEKVKESSIAVLNETVAKEKTVEEEVNDAKKAKKAAEVEAEETINQARLESEEKINQARKIFEETLKLQEETLKSTKEQYNVEIDENSAKKDTLNKEVIEIQKATDASKTNIEKLKEVKNEVLDKAAEIRKIAADKAAEENKNADEIVQNYKEMTDGLSGFLLGNQEKQKPTIVTTSGENFVDHMSVRKM